MPVSVNGTYNGKELYVKGTFNTKWFSTVTNDLVYESNKVSTNQINSTINLGTINAGIMNAPVINIPDTPSLTMTMTAADFSLEARALSVGGTVMYNGVVQVDEVVAGENGVLTVSRTPVAPLGSCDIVCHINNEKTAYLIDPQTNQVQGFTAANGQNYCVHYSTQNASAKQLSIDALMALSVVRAVNTLPIYAKENGANPLSGTHVGNLYITIPRGQTNGDVSTDGSQTTPATTNLTLNALTYDEACEAGIQCGTSVSPKLAYMVVEFFGDPDQNATGLAIVGGKDITVQAGAPYTIPVKYEMDDGEIVTPQMSDLTFTNPDGGLYFTVSNLGVITGTASGSGTVVITSKYNASLTTTANVTVTGGATNPTADVTFALTTPTTGDGNSLSGGGSTYDVTVGVVNATQSVVITGTASATQNMVIGGTNASLVTLGGNATAPTFTVDTSTIAAAGGSVSFTIGVTETGKSPILYTVTLTVAQPDTADMTFALTTPSPDTSNKIEGGGATKTVTVTVQNGISSVTLTGTKLAAQSVTVGGTDAGDVTPSGESGTSPTFVIDTTAESIGGGAVNFTITVSQDNYNSIVYNVTVTVAGA